VCDPIAALNDLGVARFQLINLTHEDITLFTQPMQSLNVSTPFRLTKQKGGLLTLEFLRHPLLQIATRDIALFRRNVPVDNPSVLAAAVQEPPLDRVVKRTAPDL
jgi:hypothetical protein